MSPHRLRPPPRRRHRHRPAAPPSSSGSVLLEEIAGADRRDPARRRRRAARPAAGGGARAGGALLRGAGRGGRRRRADDRPGQPRPPPARGLARRAGAWTERRRWRSRSARRTAARGRSSRSPAGPAIASVELAYPGVWVRDDVYATHGHYLDRHLTIPTFERLALAAVERALGPPPRGRRPARRARRPHRPRRVRARAGARLRVPVRARPGGELRRRGPGPSARIWAAMSGGADPGAEAAGLAARLGRAAGGGRDGQPARARARQARPLAGRDQPGRARGDGRGRRAARDRGRPRRLRPHPPARAARRRARMEHAAGRAAC